MSLLMTKTKKNIISCISFKGYDLLIAVKYIHAVFDKIAEFINILSLHFCTL